MHVMLIVLCVMMKIIPYLTQELKFLKDTHLFITCSMECCMWFKILPEQNYF